MFAATPKALALCSAGNPCAAHTLWSSGLEKMMCAGVSPARFQACGAEVGGTVVGAASHVGGGPALPFHGFDLLLGLLS